MIPEDRKAKIAEINASNLTPQGKILALKTFIKQEQDEEKAQADEAKQNAVKKVELLGAELVTIKGEKGDQGKQGEQGPEGKVGPQGPKGEDAHMIGPQGLKGERGEKGPAGKNGNDGADGTDGKDGNNGEKGADGSPDTAFDIKSKLESLSKNDRLDISAIKGADALQDKIVAHATDQARGILYAGLLENKSSGGGTGAGSPGPQGTQGSQGSAGATGPQGPTGPAGSGGSGEFIAFNVAQSAHGFVVGNIVRSTGADNTFTKATADTVSDAEVVGIVTTVIDTNNFTLTTNGLVTSGVPAFSAGTVLFLSDATPGALTDVEPSTSGEVSKPLAIVIQNAVSMVFNNYRGIQIGQAGPTGPTGPQGTQGSQGSLGPTGATGAQGPQGTQGTQGSLGPTGATGAQGTQGSQGTIGIQGLQGTQGSIGLMGATGPQGTQGTQGSQGSLGPTGATGPQGTQGTQGSIGIQGPQGTQGSLGPTGPQGTQGSIGLQGTQGTQGSLGPTGATGAQGTTGPTGAAGTNGAMTLLHAGSGTTSSTSAINLDTVAISGLTANDSLLIHYTYSVITQNGGSINLVNTTDSVTLSDPSGGSTIAAGASIGGMTIIRQEQQSATNIFTTTIGSGTSRPTTAGGNVGNVTSAVNQYSASVSTAWTGSWTLANRTAGNLTSGATLRWSWLVLKIAGQ